MKRFPRGCSLISKRLAKADGIVFLVQGWVLKVKLTNKIVSPDEAMAVLQDEDTIAIQGFVGMGVSDELILALERRFLKTSHPSGLTLLLAAAPGNGAELGVNKLAHASRVTPNSCVQRCSRYQFHRMAFTDWGAGRERGTVVCVHGLTRQGRDFDALARGLAARGRSVQIW